MSWLREQLILLGRLLETKTGQKKSVCDIDVAAPTAFVTRQRSQPLRPCQQLALSPCCLRLMKTVIEKIKNTGRTHS